MAKVKQRRATFRDEIINLYGAACACCGEIGREFLTVDHINNDGGEHRKRLKSYWLYEDMKKEGYRPDRYQILCMNCNWGKRFKPECPHKTALRKTLQLVA